MAAGDLSRRRYFPRQRGPEATGDYSDWDVAHVVLTRPNVTGGRGVPWGTEYTFAAEFDVPIGTTCRRGITAPKAHGTAAGLTYDAWQISFRDAC